MQRVQAERFVVVVSDRLPKGEWQSFSHRVTNSEHYPSALSSFGSITAEHNSAVGFVVDSSTIAGRDGVDSVGDRDVRCQLVFFFSAAV
jgi:hypothetical protein